MNAKLGFLSLLALTFLVPLTAQAAPVWSAAADPIFASAPQPAPVPAPDPGDTSQDTSADQAVPEPVPTAAVEAPSFQWTHYSMDDLTQSMQSLDAPAEPDHYTMDDIAQSGL